MEFSDAELEAYLDESLNPLRASELDNLIRSDSTLLQRLSKINARRSAGIHTLGEIWRRNQIGVPSREEMRDHVQRLLPEVESQYIEFRMRELKCVFTLALFQDVQAESIENQENSKTRRQKIYTRSASLLNKRKKN